MRKEFEKFFSLPLRVDDTDDVNIFTANSKIGYIRVADIKGWDTLREKSLFGLTASQAHKVQRDVANYLVTCANLMSEAEKLIKNALKEEMRPCEMCQGLTNGYICSSCPRYARILDMRNFLVKLEGGSVDAK